MVIVESVTSNIKWTIVDSSSSWIPSSWLWCLRSSDFRHNSCFVSAARMLFNHADAVLNITITITLWGLFHLYQSFALRSCYPRSVQHFHSLWKLLQSRFLLDRFLLEFHFIRHRFQLRQPELLLPNRTCCLLHLMHLWKIWLWFGKGHTTHLQEGPLLYFLRFKTSISWHINIDTKDLSWLFIISHFFWNSRVLEKPGKC